MLYHLDFDNNQEQEELELNFDIIRQQKSTTTSMADLYGYSVFADDFQRKIEEYKKLEKKTREDYFYNVFYNQPENYIEQAFQTVLTAENVVIVKEDYRGAQTSKAGQSVMIGSLVLGILFAGGIWMWLEKRRKEKKLRENNRNHA